jgi:cytochrome c oxidase cbb3-type subunit 3
VADAKKVDPIQGEILHEYDGILEADNRLPNWWLATFFGTIAFSAVYWGYYESFVVEPNTNGAYAAAMMERGGDLGEPTDEVLEAAAGDGTTVTAGAATFAANCAVCHGQRGEGLVGPNLTDAAWLHGGDNMSVYRTIDTGVLSRGMPAWGEQLPPRALLGVTAFVLSIRATNVPGRAPEGTVGGAAPAAETPPAAAEPPAAEAPPEAPAPTEGAPAEPTEAEAPAPTEAPAPEAPAPAAPEGPGAH